MNPRLVAVAGPLNNSTFPLDAEELSIGRDSSSGLTVNDSRLSRRHCLIRRESGAYKILDLKSLNGTFVNGLPVKEHTLAHGDVIAVGESRFVFLVDEEEPQRQSNPVVLSEQQVVTASTVVLRVEDALYLQPEPDFSSLPPLARMARDLTVLLKISTSVNSIRETEALQRQLLEFIFEVVPAERGAILLAREGGEEFASVFGWDRQAGPERPVQVSQTIARRVLREGIALLCKDVAEDAELAGQQSIAGARTRALLCVPLVLFGQVRGVLYLDTTDPAAHFAEEHLHLLTVIAGLAAVALNNAQYVERLEVENEQLRAETPLLQHDMVGGSARMRELYQLISRVAPTDSTVLIRGESGTGKELAARALHRNSPRRDRPFVAINCAALQESLLESELFGHERGAFTGALAQKKGKLEVADGGTVFLDEVGEMSAAMQAKLLRVLQEREFERVGGVRTVRVDVRVVAATNRDLEEAVRGGGFRQDLYYRLDVVSFEMPPLRERREDIPALAEYFAARCAGRFKRAVSGISKEARACLVGYDWPGNVRELENAVERAVVLGSTDLILPEDLPEHILEAAASAGAQDSGAPSPIAGYHEAVRQTKKQLILRAVEAAEGNYTEAARLLGVHPNYLHRLIRNLNLKTELKK